VRLLLTVFCEELNMTRVGDEKSFINAVRCRLMPLNYLFFVKLESTTEILLTGAIVICVMLVLIFVSFRVADVSKYNY